MFTSRLLSSVFALPFMVALTAACSGGGDGFVAPVQSSNPTDPTPDSPPSTTTGWSGNVEQSACSSSSAARVRALRCAGDAAQPSVVALAICGNLEADNTLTLDARPEQPEGAVLAVQGSVRVASPMNIGGNAFIAGSLTAHNTLIVAGTLNVRGTTNEAPPVTAAGGMNQGAAAPAPPIDCQNAVSVDGLVARAPDPQQAPIILSSNALAAVKVPTTVTLGCAHYRFSSIRSENELAIRIDGNATIVVEQDFEVKAPTRFEVAPGATLDLVIGGALSIDNTLSITGGSSFIGVGRRVRVASPTVIDGWLVAPKADVALDNTLTITGAAMFGQTRVASPFVVHGSPSFVAPTGCIASR